MLRTSFPSSGDHINDHGTLHTRYNSMNWVTQYGAVNNGTGNNTSAIQQAIDAVSQNGGYVYFPPGNYQCSNTITLKSNVHLLGNATITWSNQLGEPLFISNQNDYLSFCSIDGLKLISLNGSNNCFELYGVTNNCSFKRLFIQNFGGSAFVIEKQLFNTDDDNGVSNTVFEQIFVSSCGGVAFDITGRSNAIFNMCDFNSNGGGFIFRNMLPGNQSNITINGLWFESSGSVAVNVIEGDTATINLVGCEFSNCTNTVCKCTGAKETSFNLIGCNGYGFDYWIKNEVSNVNIIGSPRITYFNNLSQ